MITQKSKLILLLGTHWTLLILTISLNALKTPAQTPSEPTIKVWIYLDDAFLDQQHLVPIELSERTLQRIKTRAHNQSELIDNALPNREFRFQIESQVQTILSYSRSLKAFSAIVKPSQLPALQRLGCVKKIDAVNILRLPPIPDTTPVIRKKTHSNDSNYGDSYDQLQLINIPAVHKLGYTGAGVRIAMLDAGFFKDHEVFQHIHNDKRLIAEKDFVFRDRNVQDEELQDTTSEGAQQKHGTSVWSLIGGYKPGSLIGAAYKAEFLLAKNEYIGSETIIEEDWFVQAVEWAESMGADIISSSVAYRDFDDPEDDHFFNILDGQTTPAARAINWAFERGVLPVICAGNGAKEFPSDGGLYTPADAIGALTVGAVDNGGHIADFSSHGPTADDRTKPELCAMGVANFVADARTENSYSSGSGTSYSTPIIAGAAALLLEKYPALSPIYIIDLMKSHATRPNIPSNRYGWGIPDILAAITAGDTTRTHNIATKRSHLYTYPNPSKNDVSFLFQWSHVIPSTNPAVLSIYNLLGELIWETDLLPQIAGIKETVPWNLKNHNGEIVPSGMYIVVVKDKNTIISGKCLIYH